METNEILGNWENEVLKLNINLKTIIIENKQSRIKSVLSSRRAHDFNGKLCIGNKYECEIFENKLALYEMKGYNREKQYILFRK